MIICPDCGEITSNDVNPYDIKLRKQNFELSPVHPICMRCESPVNITHKCSGGEIIVMNGTCGGGKSTIAAELMKKHGYYAIDGDCVSQSLKRKLGDDSGLRAKIEFNSSETLAEIAYEIDCLSLFVSKFALSHIILPEDMNRYIEMFCERNLEYRFILLKPAYGEAVARCRSRTCHKTVTPESYVRYYNERLMFAGGITIIDNTGMSVEETVQAVLNS